ncbi:hypothetical protein ACJX0J_037735, partial [Zea mays]
ILFVSGVLLTIGLKPTVYFFTKPKNHKVLIFSVLFGFCFFLVLIGWLAFGMMVQSSCMDSYSKARHTYRLFGWRIELVHHFLTPHFFV